MSRSTQGLKKHSFAKVTRQTSGLKHLKQDKGHTIKHTISMLRALLKYDTRKTHY